VDGEAAAAVEVAVAAVVDGLAVADHRHHIHLRLPTHDLHLPIAHRLTVHLPIKHLPTVHLLRPTDGMSAAQTLEVLALSAAQYSH
jgi:hypothetical protein